MSQEALTVDKKDLLRVYDMASKDVCPPAHSHPIYRMSLAGREFIIIFVYCVSLSSNLVRPHNIMSGKLDQQPKYFLYPYTFLGCTSLT